MLFNKRLIKRNAQREAKARIETRDAIVWEVLSSQRLCKVKIQGSNTAIYARYPENWESTPTFLKHGNAVRITHRGGKRSNWEIVGHGRNLPTFPNPDPGDVSPTENPSENAPLTGLEVLPTNPPSMSVTVNSGTFRINGITYTLENVQSTMGDGSLGTMTLGGVGTLMGYYTLNKVTLDAPPSSGYSRTDLIVIGVDGIIDVVKGTIFLSSSSSPVIPSIPANHVKIAQIFVMGGKVQKEDSWSYLNGTWTNARKGSYTNTIEADQINREWEQSIPAVLFINKYEMNPGGITTCNINSYPFVWPYIPSNDYTPYAKISYTILDQFDREYVADNIYSDKLVAEINNSGGFLTSEGATKVFNSIATNGFVLLTINWASQGEGLPNVYVNHPIINFYLQSKGNSDILFTFINIVTGAIGTLDECIPYTAGDEEPIVVT